LEICDGRNEKIEKKAIGAGYRTALRKKCAGREPGGTGDR